MCVTLLKLIVYIFIPRLCWTAEMSGIRVDKQCLLFVIATK